MWQQSLAPSPQCDWIYTESEFTRHGKQTDLESVTGESLDNLRM